MDDEFLTVLHETPAEAFARALRERLRALEAEGPGRISFWKPTLATAALAVLLVAAGSLAFPGVRATAWAILDLFRSRTVAEVEFDPGRVASLREHMEGKIPVMLLFSEPLYLEGPGPAEVYTSPGQAAAATGMSLLVPGWLPEGLQFAGVRVNGASLVREFIDRDRLQDTFDRLDLHTVAVPGRLAESTFELHRSPIVTFEFRSSSGDLRFTQGDRPRLDAGRDLDLPLCGEIGLRVLGIEAGEAYRLARSIDWAATLVVTIPAGPSEFQEVVVRGRPGLLIAQAVGSGTELREQTLLWTEAGRVYSLTGTIDQDDMVRVAAELQ